MTTLWTTSRPCGWPAHGFQARLDAIIIGAAATIGAWTIQVLYAWDALERYYLAHYILASAGWFEKYAVLHTVDAAGKVIPRFSSKSSPCMRRAARFRFGSQKRPE